MPQQGFSHNRNRKSQSLLRARSRHEILKTRLLTSYGMKARNLSRRQLNGNIFHEVKWNLIPVIRLMYYNVWIGRVNTDELNDVVSFFSDGAFLSVLNREGLVKGEIVLLYGILPSGSSLLALDTFFTLIMVRRVSSFS